MTEQTTLQELVNCFKEEHNIVVNSIASGVGLMYTSYLPGHKARLQQPYVLLLLLHLPHRHQHVVVRRR